MIGQKPPRENYKYMTVDRFVEEVRKVNGSFHDDLLRKAFEYADRAHKDQMRASGGKYFTHSINVALILAAQKMDSTTIAAGLLHDVVEDTEVTVNDLRRDFGDEIAELVDGVSRISTYQAKTSIETKAEYFRKMLLSMAKDIRVILIKLATACIICERWNTFPRSAR